MAEIVVMPAATTAPTMHHSVPILTATAAIRRNANRTPHRETIRRHRVPIPRQAAATQRRRAVIPLHPRLVAVVTLLQAVLPAAVGEGRAVVEVEEVRTAAVVVLTHVTKL